MNLDFSNEQKEIQSEARKFLEKEGSLKRNRSVLDDKNRFGTFRALRGC
jgi:hypothetical protein